MGTKKGNKKGTKKEKKREQRGTTQEPKTENQKQEVDQQESLNLFVRTSLFGLI